MKRISKILLIFFLTALPFSLFSQDVVVILDYMKVNPGYTQDYLEIEMEWKKIHQKKVEAGVTMGWQLYRNMYTGPEDTYQYITINWYENFAKTQESAPEGLFKSVFTDKELDVLIEKTTKSRKLVSREVLHKMFEAEGSKGGKYFVVNRMKVRNGMENEFSENEYKFWKPYHEESIKRDYRTHWGVWNIWPYKEGVARYITVDGYATLEQMLTGEDFLEEIHPEMTWDEMQKLSSDIRKIASVEIWKLLDQTFLEE